MAEPGETPIRVLVVDDHSVVRQGLRTFLERHRDIEIVAEASGGAEAVELACRLEPDVVLMDLVMPGVDGIEATRQISAMCPHSRVLALTSFFADEQVFPALEAGAAGYLLKDVTPPELVRAIRAVHEGKAELHPAVAKVVLDGLHTRATPAPAEELTAREFEVLRLIVAGLSNREIADRLVISQKTVKVHVGNILGKLGLSDRTQAAVYALKRGLVDH